jgi:hypothetical protein
MSEPRALEKTPTSAVAEEPCALALQRRQKKPSRLKSFPPNAKIFKAIAADRSAFPAGVAFHLRRSLQPSTASGVIREALVMEEHA